MNVRCGIAYRSPQLHGSQHSVAADLDCQQYRDTDSKTFTSGKA